MWRWSTSSYRYILFSCRHQLISWWLQVMVLSKGHWFNTSGLSGLTGWQVRQVLFASRLRSIYCSVSTSTLYCRACRCLLTSPVQHWIFYIQIFQPSELILWDAFVSLNGIHFDPYQSVSHTPEPLPNFGVNESASTKYGVAHWIRFVQKILIVKLRHGWDTSVTKIGIPRFTRHLR